MPCVHDQQPHLLPQATTSCRYQSLAPVASTGTHPNTHNHDDSQAEITLVLSLFEPQSVAILIWG